MIYEAARAFGVRFKGQSLLVHGDISTLGFHATKLFHMIKGVVLVTNYDDVGIASPICTTLDTWSRKNFGDRVSTEKTRSSLEPNCVLGMMK